MLNLELEMKRFGVTSGDLQKLLNVSERTIRNKLNGDTDFTYPEAVKVRDTYFPSMRMEYLYSKVA